MTDVLLLDVEALYSFIVFNRQRIISFLRLLHLHVAPFWRGASPASGRSPHLETRQSGNVQETSHVYSISLRVWAEPVDATQREQGHDGEWSSMSPRPAPARLPLISGASRLAAFALACLHFFPGPFHFARFCCFATGRIGGACCRAGCRCASLASLCLLLLKAEDAVVTTLFLLLVERHLCSA